MRTTSKFVIACALLGVVACGSPPADKGANKQAAKANTAAKPAEPTAKAGEPAAKVEEPPAKVEEPATPPPSEPAEPESTAEGEPPDAGNQPPESEMAAEAEAAAEQAAAPADASAGWKAPEGADIRSEAVVPPGTPAANSNAFQRLPKTKADGPPVSGIASNGLHFDVMVVGRGWEKSRCEEETSSFSADSDDRVNICVRVVHPSDVAEELTVEWEKEGTKTKRRSSISVKAMHAYLTRGYLPIKPGYEGEWKATIKAPDGTVLATLPFTIK